MKKTTGMAVAFIALSAAVAGTAYANQRNGGGFFGAGPADGSALEQGMAPLELADADKNGEITFDEFKKAAGDRFLLADANKDGKVTVEEMAAAIEKMRAERMAKAMVERFDTDGDGAVTQAELEGRQKKVYALLDRNDDGKIVKEEMPQPRQMMGRHGGRHGGHHGGQGFGMQDDQGQAN